MRKIISGIGMVTLVLVLAGCGGSDQVAPQGSSDDQIEQTEPTEKKECVSGVEAFKLQEIYGSFSRKIAHLYFSDMSQESKAIIASRWLASSFFEVTGSWPTEIMPASEYIFLYRQWVGVEGQVLTWSSEDLTKLVCKE